MKMLVQVGNQWLKDRAREPSTWKGLALLAGVLGVNVAPELLMQVGTVVGAVIGAIEVSRKEPS